VYETSVEFHALSEIVIVPVELELTVVLNVDELHHDSESLHVAVTVTFPFVHPLGEYDTVAVGF
jgi:hypothetical protein